MSAWAPHSIQSVLIGKSKEHTSNVSLANDPDTNHFSPRVYVDHDDNFQLVSPSGSIYIPRNWR